jgi:hypothetical protein
MFWMKITVPEIKKHLLLLEDTPRRIATLTTGLEEIRLSWAPDGTTWSAVEILAHLRACAELWSFSIYAMLSADSPVLPDLDERRWAKVARYASQEFHRSFEIFAIQRAELLGMLKELPFDPWARSGTIAGRSHTVYSQARRIALHEVEHCIQFEELLLPIHPGNQGTVFRGHDRS